METIDLQQAAGQRPLLQEKQGKTVAGGKSIRIFPVKFLHIFIEFSTQLLQVLRHALPLAGGGSFRHLQRLGELRHHLGLPRLAGMQIQAERAQSDRGEAPVHHLQRRLLLRNEKHPPPQREIMRDDIGNRLGLSGTRRPVQNKTLPQLRIQHGGQLRRIRTHRTEKIFEIETGSDFIRRKYFNPIVENAAAFDQMADQRILLQRIESCGHIVPHDKLAE